MGGGLAAVFPRGFGLRSPFFVSCAYDRNFFGGECHVLVFDAGLKRYIFCSRTTQYVTSWLVGCVLLTVTQTYNKLLTNSCAYVILVAWDNEPKPHPPRSKRLSTPHGKTVASFNSNGLER